MQNMLISSLKTLKKQMSFLTKQNVLVWTDQATHCLHCGSVGSGKDARCDQCWTNWNDGWYHEPAGGKNNSRTWIYWFLYSDYVAIECQLLISPYIFYLFFMKCDCFSFIVQLFPGLLFLTQIIWCVCVEGDWTSAVFCTGSRGSSKPCF